MRILATGNRHTQTGLTLVEMLVAVAIIGLLASVVVLTVPQEPDEAEVAAFSLARQLKNARDLAILRNQIIALDIDEDVYRFVQYKDNDWVPLRLPNTRRPQSGSPDVKLSFVRTEFVAPGTIGGEQEFFFDAPVKKTKKHNLEAIFQPTGEVTQLKIVVESDSAIWSVEQSTSTDIKVVRVNE